MKILIMRDIKANAYGVPMFVASIGGAVRSFGDEINKSDGNALALHPEDYELYHVGEYNELTAEFKFCEREQVALGSNLKVPR